MVSDYLKTSPMPTVWAIPSTRFRTSAISWMMEIRSPSMAKDIGFAMGKWRKSVATVKHEAYKRKKDDHEPAL